MPVGATGGGFVLSKGVYTTAALSKGTSPLEIAVTVNGDPSYDARTTRRAIELLLRDGRVKTGSLHINQRVQVPIGSGFGASAASALSGVLATARAADLPLPESRVAYAAHVAEIQCGTGLGTVSAIFRGSGAGAITSAGAPGVAKFLRVRVPKELRIVTASIASYSKRRVLASVAMRERVNSLGEDALLTFERNPTIETLAESGERFAEGLGLETKELKHLIRVAKQNGALWASQNMIGEAIHCIIKKKDAKKASTDLSGAGSRPRVDLLDFGTEKAGVAS